MDSLGRGRGRAFSMLELSNRNKQNGSPMRYQELSVCFPSQPLDEKQEARQTLDYRGRTMKLCYVWYRKGGIHGFRLWLEGDVPFRGMSECGGNQHPIGRSGQRNIFQCLPLYH